MIDLIIFVVFVATTYFIGTAVEKHHYKSIADREAQRLFLPVVTGRGSHFLRQDGKVEKAQIVHGSVVISIDYFKRILAALRNIVGGEVSSYETLIDRARREAILRMKEMAQGADIILNLRIETAMIGQSADQRKQLGSIEVLAYGTAVKYQKQ